jgi:hypothetical protein
MRKWTQIFRISEKEDTDLQDKEGDRAQISQISQMPD